MRRDYSYNQQHRRRFLKLNHLPKKAWFYLFILGVIGLIVFIIILAVISKDLPSPNNITKNAKYATTLLDRNGKLIYQVFDDKNIVPVTYDEIPTALVNATVAIEDKNFFHEGAFSLTGILRAVFVNIFFHRVEGGSTITQQLVKNTLLTQEQTMMRKIKELILAVELDKMYTKKQILEMYFNQTPYGGSSYGVESASELYFGKHVSDLTVLESAILAGLPQNPSIFSPYIGQKGAYLTRTKQVLKRMREDKYITKADEEKYLKQLPSVTFRTSNGIMPGTHFVFYVKKVLEEMVTDQDLYNKGFVIKTTLDLDLQKKAEKIVAAEIKKAKDLNISNGALVAVQPKTGEVLAMVGSVDYANEKFGKYNAATGLRQPGSALKPFTYALAFENGLTPGSIFMDVKTEFATGKETGKEKTYTPENYDGKFRGPIQLRFALGSSLNIPAVKTLGFVGIRNFLQTMNSLGVTSLAPTTNNLNRFGLSLTLGGGEVTLLDLTSAYSTFANEGYHQPLSVIKEVRDYNNKLIYKPKKESRVRVFTKEVTFLISHILSDNNARLLTFGGNSYLNIPGKTVAVKTGTTDDKRDNWTVGYSKDLAIGVWVGNNDNSKMNQALASGVSGAAPIWQQLFQYAFTKGYQDGIIDKPDNVIPVEIDSFLGGLPVSDSKRTEYFIKGTEPKSTSSYYQKLKISKSTGKLANDYEISTKNYDEKDFYVVKETDPISQDGKNRWQEGIDAWAREQEDDKWHYPSDISDNNSEDISIQIDIPEDKKKVTDNNVAILAKAASGAKISYFRVYVNNEQKIETTENVIDQSLSLSNGVYTLKFVAKNEKDKTVEKSIKIGVNEEVKD